MNEHSFIRSIHDQLRRLNPEVFVWKISDDYAGGVPDAFYCAEGRVLFVEYKFIKSPRRNTTLVDPRTHLSKLQQRWLTDRYYQNISCAVIIGANEGIHILPGLEWQTPRPACDLKNGITKKQAAEWIIGKLCDPPLRVGADKSGNEPEHY